MILYPRYVSFSRRIHSLRVFLFQGDIEELLGKVPLYTPSAIPNDELLELPKDEDHIFHIVVM
jgi:hypothetical protein